MMFVASLSRISVDMACIHHIDGNLPEEHGKQMGGSAPSNGDDFQECVSVGCIEFRCRRKLRVIVNSDFPLVRRSNAP